MSGHGKGSAFERAICKQLSEWWRPGRDDIFWRSSQSGGRATTRRKAGKFTAGHCGDIAATDPCGVPVTSVFTIELKCGRSHGFAGDLIDSDSKEFLDTLAQAIEAHVTASSRTWLLICKRDRRRVTVYFEYKALESIVKRRKLLRTPSFRIRFKHKSYGKIDMVGLPLERFLRDVKPEDILALHEKEL